MKYVTSTIDNEFTLLGVELPKQSYNSEELSRGKRLVVSIKDDVYAKLEENKIFKQMVKDGQYIVTDEKPINRMNEMELEKEAMKSSKEAQDLKEKLDKAEALIGKLNMEMAELKKKDEELLQELNDAATRIVELEAASAEPVAASAEPVAEKKGKK